MAVAPRARKAAPAAVATAGTNLPVLKDKKVLAAVEEYVAAGAQAKLLEGRVEELRAVVVAAMAGAPTAYAGARTLSLSVVPLLPATADRVITKDMIGGVLPGKRARAGYTQLRVQ